MGDNKVNSSVESNLTNEMVAFSVDSATTDGASASGDTRWDDSEFKNHFGYYVDDKVPEITAVIDAKATWTVGKGFKADEQTTMLLDSIKGFGKDTFNTILENAMRTMLIGGNFFAEIIRDDEENLINLKPLDPSTITIIANSQGMIKGFEQNAKINSKATKKFKPEEMFYLPRNRVADEIHGRGIIQKLKSIMDYKNEAMADMRTTYHRFVVPRWIIKLDTDDPTVIATEKAKWDDANVKGENMYIPMGSAEVEAMAIAPNATLNPLAWINYLDNLFYQVGGVPKIVVGGSSEFTEKASSVVYLAFQQSVEEEQLFLEEQLLSQLNIVIDLEFPVSLENELLSDEKKDQEPTTVQPNETTAGAGQ